MARKAKRERVKRRRQSQRAKAKAASAHHQIISNFRNSMLKIFEFVAGKGKTPDYDDYEPVVKGKAKGKSGKTGKSKEEPPPLRHRSQCVCALRGGLPRLGILVSSCLAFLRASKGKGKGKEPVEEPKGKGKAKGKGKGKAGAVRLSGFQASHAHGATVPHSMRRDTRASEATS